MKHGDFSDLSTVGWVELYLWFWFSKLAIYVMFENEMLNKSNTELSFNNGDTTSPHYTGQSQRESGSTPAWWSSAWNVKFQDTELFMLYAYKNL